MAKAPGETLACDKLWTNARLATMSPTVDTPYGAIEDGVIAAHDGRIVYAGPVSYTHLDVYKRQMHDLVGALQTEKLGDLRRRPAIGARQHLIGISLAELAHLLSLIHI